MQTQTLNAQPKPNWAQPRALNRLAGFTLVELLVVIAIIGLLVALLLPAVGAVRARARSTQCLNQVKQIATAMINYQLAKEKFPGYVQPVRRDNGDFLQITSNGGLTGSGMDNTSFEENSMISWAAIILPQIEGQEIYDNMLSSAVVGNVEGTRAAIRPFEVYICPGDGELASLPGSAGLSYSVNAGAWDWDTSGNFLSGAGFGDTKANGLCHNLTYGGPTNKLGGRNDGATNTILLSENINKETEQGVALYNWAGIGSGNASSSMGTVNAEQIFGLVWVVDTNPTAATVGTIVHQYPFGAEGDTVGFPANLPAYARPRSAHPGGAFNTAFADGHVKAIDPSIDYTVYQRLMTLQGQKCVDPVDHSATGTSTPIGAFRNLAPVAPGDF